MRRVLYIYIYTKAGVRETLSLKCSTNAETCPIKRVFLARFRHIPMVRGARRRSAVDLPAVADAHDVNDEPRVAHARDHAPVADAVLPVTCPGAGQCLAEPAGILSLEEPLVDEALNAALDGSIEGSKLVSRCRMEFNRPGQAAS